MRHAALVEGARMTLLSLKHLLLNRRTPLLLNRRTPLLLNRRTPPLLNPLLLKIVLTLRGGVIKILMAHMDVKITIPKAGVLNMAQVALLSTGYKVALISP